MSSTNAKRHLMPQVQSGKVIPILKQNLLEQRVFNPVQPTVEQSSLPNRLTIPNLLSSPVITKEQVTMLVHEMRSPLCVILNVLQACQKTQLSQLEQERLTLALEEAERLRRMADETLAQARCANHPAFKWQKVRLRDLIREVIGLTAELPVAVDRKIVLVSNPPNMILKGDRDKLKQVFLNLFANACEAVDVRQTVIVHCQPEYNLHQISIKIHNGGKSIPVHLLPLLGHQQVTTKLAGSGQGLMIAKEIVTAHNGELDIDSSEVRGTTVRVSLPILRNHRIRFSQAAHNIKLIAHKR
jgi:signal transduction histidine kinase